MGPMCPYYAGTGDRKCIYGCSTEPRCITDEWYDTDSWQTTALTTQRDPLGHLDVGDPRPGHDHTTAINPYAKDGGA